MKDATSYTQELETLYRAARKQYTAIRQKAHLHVVRWEWTNGRRYDLRPLYFERMQERRGEIVPEQHRHNHGYHYGISELGRVMVEEYYERGQLGYEAFWQNLDTTTEIMYFEQEQIAKVVRLDHLNGQPQTFREYSRKYGIDARGREIYRYDAGRLMQISWQSDTWTSNSAIEYYCAYAEQGMLSQIEVSNSFYGHDFRHVIYKQPTLNPPSNADWLPDEMRRSLVQSILETLAEQKISEPVCALILDYHYGDYFFPPSLILLFQTEREARIADGVQAFELLWIPDYVGREPTLISLNPVGQAIGSALQAQLEQTPDEEIGRKAQNALAHLARDLTHAEWSGKLPITDDFIVFSFDIDGDSAVERILLSIPPEKYAMLHLRGLL